MAKKTAQPKDYEAAIEEIELILSEIEDGKVGLEQSIARYERGTFLINYCRNVLATAEQKIEQITRTPGANPSPDADEDGDDPGQAGDPIKTHPLEIDSDAQH